MRKLPNILFISRATLYTQPGGDSVQIEQTAKYLRELGYQVDIGLSGSKLEPENYDVVHFFNLIRPADILRYLSRIKRLVVSSIYVDYSLHEKKEGSFLKKGLHRILNKFGVEYIKTISRWINGSDKFPGWSYLLKGQYSSIQSILLKAEIVVTATQSEQVLIGTDFPDLVVVYKQVKLGHEHFQPAEGNQKRTRIANLARIEGMKNQLGLINAVNQSQYELDLYGGVAKNQKAYLRKCMKVSGERIHFKGLLTHNQLEDLLPTYKVHVLPSYFETTGLATIEALSAGCQAVVSNHQIQKELFGEHAHYCHPKDTASIVDAIKNAMNSSTYHIEWVRRTFSWKKAAKEISAIYLKPSE